jgi:hypothetical protein
MMRARPAGRWALAAAMALAALGAGAARAGLEVKDLQEDQTFNVAECEFPYCPVVLKFKILNNGRDDATYSLVRYGGFLQSKSGDTDNDVVDESVELFTPDCSANITLTSNCVVTLDLLVKDLNPSDDQQSDAQAAVPDSGFLWGVKVDEYLRNGVSISPGPSNAHLVSVLDDVPEPAAWLLMGSGLAVAGGLLRRARWRTSGAL